MIRIRPYKASDVDTILSWCQDEKAFYQWTAGVLGNYPITQNEFCFVESLMPFTAFDETGIVGFFTLRNPDESLDELRFGFVIVNPNKRGKGYGKAMLVNSQSNFHSGNPGGSYFGIADVTLRNPAIISTESKI